MKVWTRAVGGESNRNIPTVTERNIRQFLTGGNIERRFNLLGSYIDNTGWQ
jgi:hypothetical protein